MKKGTIRFGVFLFAIILLSYLVGSAAMQWTGKNIEENFKGLTVTIKTYDATSQVIDTVRAKSVKVARDTTFDSSPGAKDSSVLLITIGGEEMKHVGSSLIMAEDGLTDIFASFQQKNDITNLDRSVPILNEMKNQFRNDFTGKSQVLLIRGQLGFPLASYAGNRVSTFSTDIPKTTGLLVDGKKLLIYRCDYTIYPSIFLEQTE